MPDGVRIQADGLREFRRDLRKLDMETDVALRKELREAAGTIAHEASLLAPRRTGALAASYRPFTSLKGAGVRSKLPYAGVHEYGGVISPRGTDIRIRRSLPVTRAVIREQDAIVESLGDAIERAADRAGWNPGATVTH